MDEEAGKRAIGMYTICWFGMVIASVWTFALALATVWEAADGRVGYGHIAMLVPWTVVLYFYLSMMKYARRIKKQIYG